MHSTSQILEGRLIYRYTFKMSCNNGGDTIPPHPGITTYLLIPRAANFLRYASSLVSQSCPLYILASHCDILNARVEVARTCLLNPCEDPPCLVYHFSILQHQGGCQIKMSNQFARGGTSTQLWSSWQPAAVCIYLFGCMTCEMTCELRLLAMWVCPCGRSRGHELCNVSAAGDMTTLCQKLHR